MSLENNDVVVDDVSKNEELDKGISERIAKNKERALSLRKSKIVAHPYAKKQYVHKYIYYVIRIFLIR